MTTEYMTDNGTLAEAMTEMIGKNYGRSVELFSKFLEEEPNHFKALMSRGTCYLKMDDIQSAKADFDRTIELNPDNSHAFHLRGLVHEKIGDNDSAMHDFDHAIELNPEYGAAYFSRATLKTKLGNTDGAAEDIEMVTHLTNANIESFANENNVWRSNHMRMEAMLDNEMNR